MSVQRDDVRLMDVIKAAADKVPLPSYIHPSLFIYDDDDGYRLVWQVEVYQ